jgi:hypothetical protein
MSTHAARHQLGEALVVADTDLAPEPCVRSLDSAANGIAMAPVPGTKTREAAGSHAHRPDIDAARAKSVPQPRVVALAARPTGRSPAFVHGPKEDVALSSRSLSIVAAPLGGSRHWPNAHLQAEVRPVHEPSRHCLPARVVETQWGAELRVREHARGVQQVVERNCRIR